MDQLQHFSHEHTLMFKEEEQKNKDGAVAVCSGCGDPVLGPSYSCSQCLELFILHKSCADLPREMNHPIHHIHPLILQRSDDYVCDICRKPISDNLLAYRCDSCRFELDLRCASNLSNIKYLEHFCHEHALIIDEEPIVWNVRSVCEGCKEKVSSDLSRPRYRCSRILCRFYLHKSCAELPLEFPHPMHPRHPLFLNALGAKEHRCDACDKDCSGKFTYSCSQCHFNLDPECTFTWTNFKHFSHIHPLVFKEVEQNEDGVATTTTTITSPICNACGDMVLGPSYSCNQCPKLFILHKSCAELPRQMHHPIHRKDPLILLTDRHYRCDICRKSHAGLFSYTCKPCDFDLDIQCASNLSNIRYLEHFNHEHALIFVQDPKIREGDLKVVCRGCQEEVLGPSYCCSRFLCHYTLHKSCAELPREIHHPIHRKHPLILLGDRHYHCDICRKSHAGVLSYNCKPCDFDLDIQCASNLSNIKYLEHFSHEHALIFVEDPKIREGDLEVVCQGCQEEVLGPSYCCSRFLCHYTLHESCAELPREIHHPIHRKHPLILLADRHYHCDICRKSHAGLLSYNCKPCDFELDIQCASNLSNIKYLEHFSHEHALIFVEDPKIREGDLKVVCQGCQEEVLGPSYCCSRFLCHYTLHKSCVELPREIHHPIHRKHPLTLLADRHYRCDICHKSHAGLFSYSCKPCDFDVDLQCASNLNNMKCLEHFSHEHELMFMEQPRRKDKDSPVVCDGCQDQVLGPSYCCSRYSCYYTLHDSCTQLPLEIHHQIHMEHPLVLNKDRARGYRCDVCNQDCSGRFTYSCFQCDFDLDQKCAFDWKGFEHFSHKHTLLLESEPKKRSIGPLFCEVCQDPIFGPSYTCIHTFRRRKCCFNLHQKCAELPQEIEHPMHHQHRLVLLSILPDIKVCRLCRVCKQSCRFLYRCSACDFNLDLKCASNWQTILADESHKHQFTVIRRPDFHINCDVCGEYWTGAVYYICSICQLLVHKDCASLPRSVKKHDHQHQLKLTWFFDNIQTNNLSCKVCSSSIDKCCAAYCCGDCSGYVTHVACTTTEYSPEESYLNMPLSDDGPKIEHFSHQHSLVVNDLWKPVKDDNIEIKCEGCILPITTSKESFYSCIKQEEESCTFFLHKVCAQLQKTILLPLLHQHQFTLLLKAPFIGGVFQCYMCASPNQGFTYTCEECAPSNGETVFYLDLQCSAYWGNKSLKHDSHVHRLLLNIEYGDVHCISCGCDLFFCFSCKRCEYHLCIQCVRLPLIGGHRYDDHPLKLTYKSAFDELGYYCQICEGTRNPAHWFYRCNECDFDCHAHCIVGRYPQVRLGSTCRHEAHAEHPLTLVDKARSPIWFDKRENILPCLKCEEPCVGLVFECKECNINIHREGYCHLTVTETGELITPP